MNPLLVVYVLASLFVKVEGQRQPQISNYGPNYLTPKPGSEAKFSCDSVYTPDAVFKWFKMPYGDLSRSQKQEIIFPNPDFKKGDGVRNPNTLVISNADAAKHNGEYTCSATNEVNTTMPDYNLKLEVAYLNAEFEYTPRNTFFYDFGDKRMAWANCKPPLSAPSLPPKWINGSSGVEVKVGDDPRFVVREFSRNGLYSQMILSNATIYDVGTWSCRYEHIIATVNANFTVSFYGNPEPAKNLHVKQMRLKGFVIEWDYLRNDLLFYDIEVIKSSTNEKQTFVLDENPSFVIQILEYEIKNLELGTEYKVRLRATSELKQVGDWSNYLTVKTAANLAPIMLEQPKTASIGEGLPYTIVCGVQAFPEPTYEWFRNGFLISESDSRYQLNGMNLTMLNPKHGEDESEALYKCKATNSLGSITSDEAKINVEWIETNWLLKPRDVAFYHGEAFTRISARPPNGNNIKVQWFQNRQLIYGQAFPSYSATNYLDPNRVLYYALDIKNIDRNAEGAYTCIASNLAGQRVAYFFLAERAAPPPITVISQNGVTSGAIVLTWDPPLADQKVQNLGESFKYRTDLIFFNITYTNIQRDNNTHWYVGTEGEFTDTRRFSWKHRISDLRVGEKYSYKIKSTDRANQVSTWSEPFYYTIPENLPPFISSSPLPSEKATGDSIVFTCEISSDPAARVKWFKDGQEITSSKYKMVSSGSVYNLSIAAIERGDAGQYYCNAKNDNGEATSEKANLDVLYFDKVFRYSNPVAPFYSTSTEVRILCIPPLSNPPARIYWSNSTYTILSDSEDFVSDDRFLSQGIQYFSLLVKNPSKYVGLQVGCAAYNPKFGFNDKYELALTNITFYSKPSLKKPVTYSWKLGPTLVLNWEKERPDFISYIIILKEQVWPNKILANTDVKEPTVSFTGFNRVGDYIAEIRVIDAGKQLSDPIVIEIKDLDATPVVVSKDLPSILGELKEGTNSSLECDFSGEPTPHISWYKDGANITISNGSFEVANNNRKLKLININRDIHSGFYQCVGNTEFYRNVKTTLSRVIVIWIGDTFQYADNEKLFYDLDGYRKVSFSCAPPKSDPPIDRGVQNYVIWLKDGKAMNRPTKVINDNGLLKDTIEFDATKSDIGQYSCVYVHKAGTRRHDMTLNTYDGPLPPTNLTVAVTKLNVVILTWESPKEGKIDSYVISYGQTDLTNSIDVDGTKNKYELENLEELKSYKISIVSKTDGKSSLPLTQTFTTVKRPGLPSAVRNVGQEDISNSTITLTWDLPENLNGNSKVTYVVKICEGTTCNTYTDLINNKLVLNNLKAGTKYSYAITARGDLPIDGPKVEGEFVTASNQGLPPIVNFFSTGKKWDSLEVQWDPPIPMSKVQYYTLQVSGLSKIQISKDVTTYKIENLVEGTEYVLTIAASDINSNTGVSTTIRVKTVDLDNPGKVGNLMVKALAGFENSKVTISWLPPPENQEGNNIHITYHVRYCHVSLCFNVSKIDKTYLQVSDLSSNTRYQLTVTTVRDDGKPGEQAIGEFVTAEEKISEPVNSKVEPSGLESIFISWSQPQILAGTNAKDITYKITYCVKGTKECKDLTVTDRATTLSGLKPATSYTIEISARHQSGVYGKPLTLTAETKSDDPGNGGSGMSAGVVIGIVLAVIVVIILLAMAALYYRKQQRQKSELEQKISEKGTTYNQGTVSRQQQNMPPTLQQKQAYNTMPQYGNPHRQPQVQYYQPQQLQQQQQYRRPPSQQHRRDMYEMEMARRR